MYIEAQIVPFGDEHILIPNQFEAIKQNLLRLPLLHTFWVELNENDGYKNTTRDDLCNWINRLTQQHINEWLVIVLEPNDKKLNKSAKLLSTRTSPVDKVRADFPPNVKNATDHCIALCDPSKSVEIYQQFQAKLRNWLLSSYSRHLSAYEDYIRTERERRNSSIWNFFEFFFLQEQLAFAFEALSLYDEALVQYDELDALFSQFVINSNIGEMPDWLRQLSDDCDNWHGLCLATAHSKQLRLRLQGHKRSLLDLRSYLFARQCELLLLHNRPWELASRSLPFLQNAVTELKLLEVGFYCWLVR